VTISHASLSDVVAHAREAQPAECCGVLIGRGDTIVDTVRVRNVADSAARYLLDPHGHIDARRKARHRGLDVIGFYHSHPHSAAEPSATDVAEATYPDLIYLIVSVKTGTPEARLFRLAPDAVAPGVVEVPLVVTKS
jgi:proteasome lid subunit RPN8/RPN11